MMDDLTSETLYRQNHLQHSVLNAEDEHSILSQASRGNRSAINKMVEHNQRLVTIIALRYLNSGMVGDHELMDLVQYGNLGLLEAIRHWDETRKTRFSTYATWWIRAMIRRGSLMHGSTLARTAREGDLLFVIRKSIIRLQSCLRRAPTPEEISVESRISLKLVKEHLPLFNAAISLDVEDEHECSLNDTLPSAAPSPDKVVEAYNEIEHLMIQLAKIPPREARVLFMRYGIEGKSYTLTEIAECLHISRARVQDIEKIALRRLRTMIAP